MGDNSIAIIGAGFAGLAAGIYGQMNGYRTQVFEMHDKPGGLCTAWQRKGYTIDGCIHWLVGSSPQSGLYRYWQEVGLVQGREFVNLDRFAWYEAPDGRTCTLYVDVDRLEEHLLEFAPQDAAATREFIRGIRLATAFDPPDECDPPLQRLAKGVRLLWTLVTHGSQLQRLMKTTGAEFAARFTDPALRGALEEMWLPEFSVAFMLFTFAYLHRRNAGYPIGGSLPMARALEQRYRDLGGVIQYRSRVETILVEADRAVGVRLADGSERRAGRVISAADGYTTIFKMLEGRFGDEKTREPYEKWPTFPPLLYVGVGVNRSFADFPCSVYGFSFPLRQPTEIGDAMHNRLPVRILNQDPTLAPPGKTTLIVILPSRYEYWKELAEDRAAYREKKEQVARTVVELLEERFPGLARQVEVVDVATPLTFERYTGNWKGSFEGWMLTPQNAMTMMKPMSQTLPGLARFAMCGQWVQPGGGLPPAVISARRLIQALCREDGKRFQTRVD